MKNVISSYLQADLNWEVEVKNLTTEGSKIILPNHKAITRNDTGEVLHIGSKSFTPTTNAQFKDVVSKIQKVSGLEFAGYGEMHGGGKVFAFLKDPKNRKLCGWDTSNYMMIGNGNDGSMPLFIGMVNRMLRCENQFSYTMRTAKKSVDMKLKAYHTKNHIENKDEMVKRFEHYIIMRDELVAAMTKIQKVKIDSEIMSSLVDRMFDIEAGERAANHVSTKKLNQADALMGSVIRETKDLGNNLFGFFNGVTHYTTHVANSKHKGFGNPIGVLNNINEKALNLCLEMA